MSTSFSSSSSTCTRDVCVEIASHGAPKCKHGLLLLDTVSRNALGAWQHQAVIVNLDTIVYAKQITSGNCSCEWMFLHNNKTFTRRFLPNMTAEQVFRLLTGSSSHDDNNNDKDEEYDDYDDDSVPHLRSDEDISHGTDNEDFEPETDVDRGNFQHKFAFIVKHTND